MSTLAGRSTKTTKSDPAAGQAPRRRGRPAVPLLQRPVRYDLAIFRAIQTVAPEVEPALAADLAAALASPRGKLDANMFNDIACGRLGFEGLRRRGKYLQHLFAAEVEPLSGGDAAWIYVSSRRIATFYRALSLQSDDPVRRAAAELIAATEYAALEAMGWAPMLNNIFARIKEASTTSTAMPDRPEGEHLAAIGEQLLGKKANAGFNCPRFPTNTSLPSEEVIKPSTDPEMNLGLLRGIKRIAQYLELPDKQVERLHLTGDLPTFKIRSRICARKATLDRWVLEQERAGLDARKGSEA